MRNSLKCTLSVACLALALPAAQAFHQHVVYVPASAPVTYQGQTFGAQAVGVHRFFGSSAQAFQVPAAQAYWVQNGVNAQGIDAQGVGLDLATQFLKQFVAGGLGNLNPGGGLTNSSSVVTELQNNTKALQANTAALKALTQAFNANNGPSPDSSPSAPEDPSLAPVAGVNAEAVRVARNMIAAQAAAVATKPAANPDYLGQARAQIKAANDAVQAAQLFLNTANTRNTGDADEIKFLNDQLKKVGIAPAPATK